MRVILRLSKPATSGTNSKPVRPSRRSTVAHSRATKSQSRKAPTPRWFLTLFFSVYILAIVWSMGAYSAEAGDLAAASASPNIPAYIESAAKIAGVDPRVASWIVSHESQYDLKALGDNGDSRGIWQINKTWHPEVSDRCAYDLECSTEWSLGRIAAGNAHEWSTWKYCRERFDDCPF
jgi:hypothetical protein